MSIKLDGNNNFIILQKIAICVTFAIYCIVFCVMKSATLNLRISPSIKDGIKKAATIEHRSIANMIEILIRRHCQDNGIAINDNLESNGENSNG